MENQFINISLNISLLMVDLKRNIRPFREDGGSNS
jgi:hypothetical protein